MKRRSGQMLKLGLGLLLVLFLVGKFCFGGRRVAAVHVPDIEDRPVSQPLIDAAERGDLTAAKRLLDHGVSPDSVVFSPNHEERCALEIAASSGHPEMVRLLLDRGADVNAPNFWGGTAITAAAVSGDPEATRLLIRHGADVNANDDGAVPLGYALYGLQHATNTTERAHFAEVVLLLRRAGARDSWLPW